MASPAFPALLLGFILLVAGCSEDTASKKDAPGAHAEREVEVGIVTLKPASVPRDIELPGRVEASATAQIRPQVDGIIEKLAFKEGGPVKAGDVLYKLESSKFKAAFDAAQAAVHKAQASVTGAQDTLDRNEGLVQQKAVSQQELETARTALLQANADLEAAKADLETARINLSNATITAPISGTIGTSSVSVGALVSANQTDALATIRETDPVYVDLVDTSANLLRIREKVQSGRLGREDNSAPTVKLTLENGETYERAGKIELADLVVSETTGTFPIRAVFANPDRLLLPGMFVRAKVDLGVMPNAYLVPQRAVTRNAAGEATANFVDKDGKVDNRIIVTDGTANNDWIVTEGVKEGDRLIVDGLQKISQGAKVKPVEVKIDDNGVIAQTIGTKEDKTATETEAAK
jgi:membrane fusion protein (multidrug efflux system)